MTAIRAAIAAAFLCALPSTAQDDQAIYHRVVDVEPDDALNIRAQPDAEAEILGILPHDASLVEVAEIREANGALWGQVAAEDGAGWVAMRYLEPLAFDEYERLGDTDLPAELQCGGTEPFWSINFHGDTAVMSELAHDIFDAPITVERIGRAQNRGGPLVIWLGSDIGEAIVSPELCSDGMSDTPFAWRVYLIRHNQGGRLMDGCCRARGQR